MSDLKESVLQKLANDIMSLDLLEVKGLLDILKEKLGISGDALMAATPQASASTTDNAISSEAEEPASFVIKLTSFSDKVKIKLIKLVKQLKSECGVDLGLKDVKDLLESCPVVLFADLPKEKFEDYKKKLSEVGAELSFQE